VASLEDTVCTFAVKDDRLLIKNTLLGGHDVQLKDVFASVQDVYQGWLPLFDKEREKRETGYLQVRMSLCDVNEDIRESKGYFAICFCLITLDVSPHVWILRVLIQEVKFSIPFPLIRPICTARLGIWEMHHLLRN